MPQLDGLRGIAILLVILNHLRFEPLYKMLPENLHVWLETFTGNGRVGVSILFLLSGYLMSTYYPVIRNKASFLQKRYTRIFPAFVMMCTALALIRYFWIEIPVYGIIAIVVAFILIGGMLWKLIQNSPQRVSLGKNIFKFFIFLQVFVFFGYLLLQFVVPSAVFYQVWPEWAKSFTYFLVNSTLTLPFGTFVPQLDGVYWSVAAEVSFYILLPILFIPFMEIISNKKSSVLSWIAATAVLPFFYGLSLIFKGVLGLEMMQIHLGVYFVLGILIGYNQATSYFKKIQEKLSSLPAMILAPLCLFAILGLPYVRGLVHLSSLIDMICWTLPLTLMYLATLDHNNWWSRFLTFHPLVKIGQLSYSLYLTHTIAIEMFTRTPAHLSLTDAQTFTANAQAVVLMTALSFLIYHFLERPYFENRITQPKTALLVKKTELPVLTPSASRLVLPAFILVFLFLVWYAYRIPAPLRGKVINHHNAELPATTIITQQPMTVNFQATDPNLGMVLVYLKPLTEQDMAKIGYIKGTEANESLLISVLDESGNVVVSNKYALYQIFESRFHPVGLPLFADSAGKNLQLKLQITSEHSDNFAQPIYLINNGVSLRTVYFVDKKDLLANPWSLVTLLANKIIQPFQDQAVTQVFLLTCPLLLLLIAASYSLKRN